MIRTRDMLTDMRHRLICIVRPQRAEQLCVRLLESGLADELTAAEVRGHGRQKDHLDEYGGVSLDVLPKVEVTAVIASEDRDAVIELVNRTARTGRIGDGKVFLLPIAAEVAT